MKQLIALSCGLALAASGFAESGKLTLDRALALARQNSPELKAARANTLAAEKMVAATGRWKSPSLHFEAEGVGGDLDGFEETEYTLALKQTFERGGKRKNDRAVAQTSIGVAFEAEAEKELELMTAVRLAFIEVAYQQEVGKVRVEQEQLARAFVSVAAARHAAGGSSELEVVQAELALEEVLLSQTCCFGDLLAARVRLASLIGWPENEVDEVEAAYYELENPADSTLAESHPALRRVDALIAVSEARAAAAKSKDAADITLGAGYKYEAAGDVNTLVFGASMPLNFVRAGQAEQAATLVRADALRAERAEVRRTYQRRLSTLAAQYAGAKLEAEMTRDKLAPKAEKAYELSKAGYEAGRFSWIELIASQQHLAEIRARQIEALRDAHVARAELTKFLNEGR